MKIDVFSIYMSNENAKPITKSTQSTMEFMNIK